MVVLDKGGIGTSSGLSGHSFLDLKSADLHELVHLKVSRTLSKVVPVELRDSCRNRM